MRALLPSDAISPKITNTVTHTATMAMGKMKNWRTRKGVVWRSGASSVSGPGGGACSSGGVMRGEYRPEIGGESNGHPATGLRSGY